MANSHPRRSTHSFRFERLEDRRLLAADIDLDGASVFAEGTDNADAISVDYQNNNTEVLITIRDRATNEILEQEDYDVADIENIELHGLGGDDYLVNNTGVPVFQYGGAGSDLIAGGTSPGMLDGGDGNDVIGVGVMSNPLWTTGALGGAGDDYLIGGSNMDFLYGGEGNDVIYGYAGDDVLHGEAGDDYIVAGYGADWIYGGDGADRIHGDQGNDVVFGEAGIDWLYGGADNDSMDGGAEGDWMFGEAGNDLLHGNTGGDALSGGDGNDRIYGDDDNDYLNGDAGDDRLYGNAGNDVLRGGFGVDRLYTDLLDQAYGDEGVDYFDDVLEGWFSPRRRAYRDWGRV
jgi:Ca2+-binding RTX toxin-like protein